MADLFRNYTTGVLKQVCFSYTHFAFSRIA